MSKLEKRSDRPIPITTEDFDRKVEAGEDIDVHLDWDSAVLVAPGEMSPGQKLTLIQSLLDDLLKVTASMRVPLPGEETLSISLSPIVIMQIAKEAISRGTSREGLVQAWIEAKLDEQHAVK